MGRYTGWGKETSRIRSPSSPACLEWRPKLNRKVSLHVHGIPPRFFATQPRGVPCRRGYERERVRVDGWCSNVDHHQKQYSQEKKSQERPLQATRKSLCWHVHWCAPFFLFLVAPAQCKRCSSRSSSRSTSRSVSSSMRHRSRNLITAARSARSTSCWSRCCIGACTTARSSPAPSTEGVRASSFFS